MSNPEFGPSSSNPGNLDPETAAKIAMEFGYTPPTAKGEFDERFGAHVLWRMGSIERAARYENGNYQTNADHIGRMALLADMMIYASGRDDVDPGEVQHQIMVHELDEGFVGDTPHHDPIANATKAIRHAAGEALADKFLEIAPALQEISREYNERISRAANVAKAIDVLEKLDFAIRTQARTQRENSDDFHEFAKRALREMSIDRMVYDWGKYLLQQIALKWDSSWGCMPYDGDPKTIIDDLEQEVMEDMAREEVEREAAREYGSPMPNVELFEDPALADEDPLVDGS